MLLRMLITLEVKYYFKIRRFPLVDLSVCDRIVVSTNPKWPSVKKYHDELFAIKEETLEDRYLIFVLYLG